MRDSGSSGLGAILKTRRREKRMSLRDLSDVIGVSLNTLSRVERGHLPDLKNFRRIVDWLELPPDAFLEPSDDSSTPEIIARHLLSDRRLGPDAAARIASIVEDMYHKLIGERPALALHLRSAKTFTPAASALLADMLAEMQSNLSDASRTE